MKTTLEVLRNKIDQFGLSDPSIRTQGDDRIIIEIPGTSDPEKVRRFIMGKGSLTFHIVDTDALQKVKDYAAAHPGVLLDAAGQRQGHRRAQPSSPKGDVLRGVFRQGLLRPGRAEGLHGPPRRGGAERDGDQERPGGAGPAHGPADRHLQPHPRGRGDILQAHQRERRQDARRRTGRQGQGAGDHPGAHPRPGQRARVQAGGGATTWPSRCARAPCPCPWRSPASRQSALPSGRTPSARESRRACIGVGLVMHVHAALLPPGGLERRPRAASSTSTSTSPSSRCSASRSPWPQSRGSC